MKLVQKNNIVSAQESYDFMYHISQIYMGKSPLFVPRIPAMAKENGENYRTKRICVAPSVEKCVLGIDGVENMSGSSLEIGESWYVYRTKKKGVPAKSVLDFETTKEHWIKEETRFEYFGRLFRIQEEDFAVYKNKKIIFEFECLWG